MDEPKQTVFPANRNLVRGFLGEWRDYEEEDEAPVQPNLINIEFSRLALYFMPGAKNDPELAHKMAWEFLKAGFDYFPPPPCSTADLSARYRSQAEANAALMRGWKANADSPVSLSDAVKAAWCRHKSVRTLTAMLKRVDYPQPYFKNGGLINEDHYRLASERDAKRRKELETVRKREERKTKQKRESPR